MRIMIAAIAAAAGLVLVGAADAPARADWDDARHQGGHGGPPRQAEWHHDDGHHDNWRHDDFRHGDGHRDGWHGDGWHGDEWHREGWYPRPSPWLNGYVYAAPPSVFYEPPPVYYVPPVVPLPPVLSFDVTIP